MPPGLPPQMEYPSGDRVPFIQDERGASLDLTRWRCMSCGATTEYTSGQSFGHCGHCASGERWGFVDARSRT